MYRFGNSDSKKKLLKLQSTAPSVIITDTDNDQLNFDKFSEVKCGIFASMVMVDQAHEGLYYQGINLMFLICLTEKRSPILTYCNFVLIKLCYYYAPLRSHRK